MKSLTREANGNVVLRSGHFTMRFDRMFGGTPLEWYSEDPYGMLTNAFPGNGTSVYYNTGQDPTQASSNGFLPNPIATGSPDTAMYSYYSSEKLYSPSANTYIVGGRCSQSKNCIISLSLSFSIILTPFILCCFFTFLS